MISLQFHGVVGVHGENAGNRAAVDYLELEMGEPAATQAEGIAAGDARHGRQGLADGRRQKRLEDLVRLNLRVGTFGGWHLTISIGKCQEDAAGLSQKSCRQASHDTTSSGEETAAGWHRCLGTRTAAL